MDETSNNDINPVLATTHRVGDTIMTVESLHNAAAFVNERERKPAILAEHDHLCPPMGQAVAYRVVPIENGHHALVASYDVFPAPKEIELPSGELGYQQHSEKHSYPFTTGEFHHPDRFCVGVDPTTLGGIRETNEFFGDLREKDDSDFETQPIGRRSLLPDPEVIFTLGLKASAAWFGLRVAKAAADTIEAELKTLFQVMIDAVKHMAANAIPKNRPVTYVLQVHGKPNLEFIARTRDADAVIAAMADRDLSDLRPQIDQLRKGFKAEMIQFQLRDDGTWAFNYLLTKDGKVVGTKESFDRRAVVLEEMNRKRKGKKDT